MANEEKADAAKDKVAGKAKETTGKVTGDSQTEAEGQGQQLQGKVKETAEDLKDKAKGFTDSFKDKK